MRLAFRACSFARLRRSFEGDDRARSRRSSRAGFVLRANELVPQLREPAHEFARHALGDVLERPPGFVSRFALDSRASSSHRATNGANRSPIGADIFFAVRRARRQQRRQPSTCTPLATNNAVVNGGNPNMRAYSAERSQDRQLSSRGHRHPRWSPRLSIFRFDGSRYAPAVRRQALTQHLAPRVCKHPSLLCDRLREPSPGRPGHTYPARR